MSDGVQDGFQDGLGVFVFLISALVRHWGPNGWGEWSIAPVVLSVLFPLERPLKIFKRCGRCKAIFHSCFLLNRGAETIGCSSCLIQGLTLTLSEDLLMICRYEGRSLTQIIIWNDDIKWEETNLTKRLCMLQVIKLWEALIKVLVTRRPNFRFLFGTYLMTQFLEAPRSWSANLPATSLTIPEWLTYE